MRKLGHKLAPAQGVAGVVCAAAGLYLVAGAGWALLLVGAFLLLGAALR